MSYRLTNQPQAVDAVLPSAGILVSVVYVLEALILTKLERDLYLTDNCTGVRSNFKLKSDKQQI